MIRRKENDKLAPIGVAAVGCGGGGGGGKLVVKGRKKLGIGKKNDNDDGDMIAKFAVTNRQACHLAQQEKNKVKDRETARNTESPVFELINQSKEQEAPDLHSSPTPSYRTY